MENLEDKGVSELSRIPSPSSVSSVHSVKPLEWDSGADIGYRCKVSSSLSTVERMALVRGTANLLETCQPASTAKFSAPLAHSSPFVGGTGVYDVEMNTMENEPARRLVDYSLGDDESLHFSTKNVGSGCRSLDDLRRAVRKSNSLGCKCTSRSSNNVATTPKTSSHLSSSSVITITGIKKFSNKAVQVNGASLKASSNECSSTSTSGIHPLTNSVNATYSVQSDRAGNTSDEFTNCPSRITNVSHSNADSSDKGSFEFVPGSVYGVGGNNGRSLLNSDSDVNTLCSEVINGVELVTKYVDNLQLSNKKKVIRKIVRTLANNLSNAKSWIDESAEDNGVSLGNSDKELENRLKKPASNHDSAMSNSKECFDNVTSSGGIPVTSSSICNSVRIDGVSQSISNVSTENQFNVGSKCRQNSGNITGSSSSTNIGPLKEFLEKERETQLLWIKSGIDHLNNLKKLYENQKLLKENLRSLKKKQSLEVISTSKNPQKRFPSSQSQTPLSTLSSRNQFSRNEVENSTSTETSHRSHENEISRISSTRFNRFVTHSTSNNKIWTQIYTNQYKRNGKLYKQCVQNKENLSQNQLPPRKSESCSKLKPPISYTVLFDKKPSFQASQNYMVDEEIRNGISKECSRRSRSRRKFDSLKSSTKSALTLQDYLWQNKPEYVNKAERRRMCLEKISKLRYLRDKSRSELFSTLHSEPDKIRCSVPPPLSIIRIFDDKSMKQLTAKKYQQLPEVQNKKLELKREENYRQNQIMAKIFTKKLQKKVLKGQVNLSNNVNLISY